MDFGGVSSPFTCCRVPDRRGVFFEVQLSGKRCWMQFCHPVRDLSMRTGPIQDECHRVCVCPWFLKLSKSLDRLCLLPGRILLSDRTAQREHMRCRSDGTERNPATLSSWTVRLPVSLRIPLGFPRVHGEAGRRFRLSSPGSGRFSLRHAGWEKKIARILFRLPVPAG